MEYQVKLVLVFLVSYLTNCVSSAPLTTTDSEGIVLDLLDDSELDSSAPLTATESEGTVLDLLDDSELDLADQVDNVVNLALLFMDFGYLEKKPGFTAEDLNKTELNTQIEKFQKNAGIKVTGTITGSTMLAANSPRCGRADVEPATAPNDGDRNKRYVIAGSRNKWTKNSLTWRLDNFPTSNKITRNQVLKDIRLAFKTWSDVTPLEFTQVSTDSDADIRIQFGKRQHGRDSRDPQFDGRGGVLAHAFYPNSGWGQTDGDVHFDDDEEFTYKNKAFGTNLFYTASHEIGHALGLQHSSADYSLMNAYDRGYIPDYKLPKDDILGIQAVYGVNTNAPSVPDAGSSTEPEPEATVTETPAHGDCENAHIAVTIIEGSLFVFQGEYLWRYQGEHVNQRLLTPLHGFPIRRYFKDGPKSIDTAFTYSNGSAAFIRGKNMWTYDIRTRQTVGNRGSYPRKLNHAFGIPKDLDASFLDERMNVAYFFKGDQMWKYDTANNRLLTKSSIPASEEFEDLPTPLNGAYADHDGHRFFIKGQKYWQYNEGEKRKAPGYPRLFAFLDCH